MQKDRLEPLVEAGMTLAEIGRALGRSPSTVQYWLRKHDLKTRNGRGPRPSVARAVAAAARAEGARSITGTCGRHGETTFVIETSGRVRCRRCRMDRVSERRRKVKRILVEEAGGECAICSYHRFVGALHFHHLDPSTKAFGLAEKGITLGIDRLRKEAGKCVLPCANCHVEVEAGVASLPS